MRIMCFLQMCNCPRKCVWWSRFFMYPTYCIIGFLRYGYPDHGHWHRKLCWRYSTQGVLNNINILWEENHLISILDKKRYRRSYWFRNNTTPGHSGIRIQIFLTFLTGLLTPDDIPIWIYMRNTARYFYKVFKTILHKPTANSGINIFYNKCVNKYYLQLLY
jgi:hypothetical protein